MSVVSDQTPAQRQADFLATLGEHLQAHPDLAELAAITKVHTGWTLHGTLPEGGGTDA